MVCEYICCMYQMCTWFMCACDIWVYTWFVVCMDVMWSVYSMIHASHGILVCMHMLYITCSVYIVCSVHIGDVWCMQMVCGIWHCCIYMSVGYIHGMCAHCVSCTLHVALCGTTSSMWYMQLLSALFVVKHM